MATGHNWPLLMYLRAQFPSLSFSSSLSSSCNFNFLTPWPLSCSHSLCTSPFLSVFTQRPSIILHHTGFMSILIPNTCPSPSTRGHFSSSTSSGPPGHVHKRPETSKLSFPFHALHPRRLSSSPVPQVSCCQPRFSTTTTSRAVRHVSRGHLTRFICLFH